ncbi:hypothetical protein GQ457_18G006450 [Hibiscus cannabinus]
MPGNRLSNTGSNMAEDFIKKKKRNNTQEHGNRLLEKNFRKNQPEKRFSRSPKDHVFQETHTQSHVMYFLEEPSLQLEDKKI